jgi:anti-sigma factor RsiW
MDCKDIKSKLGNYTGGRLPREGHNQVRAHLRACPLCRAALAEIDPVAAVLLQADPPPVPCDLAGRILAAARDRICPESTANWNPVAWLRLASIPVRVAAALMLFFGITAGLKLGTNVNDSQNQVTISENDPLNVYQISYIADLPEGSLADSYLNLIEPTDGGKE